MSNVILTNTGVVTGPPLRTETEKEPVMAEAPVEFPHWYYSPQEPAGRVFESQEALDAARGEGPWYPTPSAAADATAAPAPEGESTPPRTRR